MSLEESIAKVVEETVRRVLREERGRPGPAGDSLTTDQAAEVADVTPKTVLAWINEGIDGRRLKAGRRGKRRIVHRADLEAFLAGEKPPPDRTEALLRRIG
jgi:excisionase family DNA binding protein